ncbi:AsmA-like C-terminal region-containing protein [Methylobacterium sp. M6A4_1b]
MDQETAKGLRPARPAARRRPLLWIVAALAIGLVIAVGGLIGRLAMGPLRIDGMSERVASAIAGSIGPGWRVHLTDSALEIDPENSLALRVAGLDVRNPEGALVVRAPLAVVSLDTWSLLRLAVQPRAIEFRDLQMTALVHRNGSIAFAASDSSQAGTVVPHTLPSVDAAAGHVSPISAGVASIFGVVLDSAGVIGALDRARITNGRLTLIDDDARQRAVFEHVNGLFRRDAVRDARVFELRIDGPHGEWRFGGDLHEAGGTKRTGIITLDDLPINDLLLLSGQSKLPVETDLKVSAKADVAIDAGRIETMTAEIRTGGGSVLIEQKDFNPVTIDSLAAAVSWDEAGRAMKLDSLDYRGAGNAVRLSGAWTAAPPGADSAWTLELSGKDAVLRGANAGDKPVTLDTISTHLTGKAGGVVIDEVAVRAGAASGRITGTIGTAADDDGLTLHIVAADTDGRTALRLWPEHVAPPARNYLVDNLRGGRVNAVDITMDMSGPELAAATRGEPMPDNAVHIDFSVSDASLVVSADAPPLTRGRVTGTITGLTTTIRNVTADLRMQDSRTLSISDGSFVIPKITPDTVVAQIGLRLGGGADALVSLLQTKMFKSLTGVDLDPATVKGSADLRIDFPLNLKHMPDLPDLPVTMTGTLADIAVDRAFGKERLEAGRFSVSYDRGAFALKGDGRVLGSALTVDLRQPKAGAPGEINVALALDEALRARKGLPVAPLLSGTIPVRINVPIGRPTSGKAPIRVEADLARAGSDGLLPGFTKAVGKPGRASFTMQETAGGGMELRDLSVEASPLLARGSATLNGEGGFERADLSSFKLSPGDDMRLQAERNGNGYRIGVKGAVADARPFLRNLGGPDAKGGRDGAPKDIDADLSLGILTGFNGESLTNATVKVALRGRDIRSGRIQGKFTSAPFSAQITHSDRGGSGISIETLDAGSTLRFADIYKRMYGGKLIMTSALNDGPQPGSVQIRNFVLRNEPALSSIMAQGPATSEVTDARGRKYVVQNAGNDVEFDRLRAIFTRTGSRIDISDAAISNPAMGFTMTGFLDTAKERTDINGTFVPLYGLNNVVSQLPILGQLLGGGRNEGLFALNFRVSGRLAKPDVSVNPLSALAPGILRKLFSAGGGNDGLAAGTPMNEIER